MNFQLMSYSFLNKVDVTTRAPKNKSSISFSSATEASKAQVCVLASIIEVQSPLSILCHYVQNNDSSACRATQCFYIGDQTYIEKTLFSMTNPMKPLKTQVKDDKISHFFRLYILINIYNWQKYGSTLNGYGEKVNKK